MAGITVAIEYVSSHLGLFGKYIIVKIKELTSTGLATTQNHTCQPQRQHEMYVSVFEYHNPLSPTSRKMTTGPLSFESRPVCVVRVMHVLFSRLSGTR